MRGRFWGPNLRAPLCSDQWNAVSLRLECSVSSGDRAGWSLGACVPGSSAAVQTSVWSWAHDVITTPANFLMHWPQSPHETWGPSEEIY